MKESVNKAYAIAKERYAELGVDTEKVLSQMQDFHLSMHCWQADDVKGFEVQAGALSGGIQSTGNYPGAARNIDELRADILKAKSLIPGTHRLNLHEIYGDFKGKVVDRNEVTVDYFQSWIDWAKENDTKLDFNSTSFSLARQSRQGHPQFLDRAHQALPRHRGRHGKGPKRPLYHERMGS